MSTTNIKPPPFDPARSFDTVQEAVDYVLAQPDPWSATAEVCRVNVEHHGDVGFAQELAARLIEALSEERDEAERLRYESETE